MHWQPMEQALRTCVLSTRIGRELGLEGDQLSDVYDRALLRFVGCTSDAHEQAVQVGGDEIAFRTALAPVIMGEPREVMGRVVRHVGAGAYPVLKAATEAVHAALPNSQIVVLPGQQHTAMNTAPELFVREVLQFLQA
jgi:pimeloyl-ACP methyl ester carboxylesterase